MLEALSDGLWQVDDIPSDASQNVEEESSSADVLPRVEGFGRVELEIFVMNVCVDDRAEDKGVGSCLEADRNRQSVS